MKRIFYVMLIILLMSTSIYAENKNNNSVYFQNFKSIRYSSSSGLKKIKPKNDSNSDSITPKQNNSYSKHNRINNIGNIINILTVITLILLFLMFMVILKRHYRNRTSVDDITEYEDEVKRRGKLK